MFAVFPTTLLSSTGRPALSRLTYLQGGPAIRNFLLSRYRPNGFSFVLGEGGECPAAQYHLGMSNV